MAKKQLSILLVLALCFSLLSPAAVAMTTAENLGSTITDTTLVDPSLSGTPEGDIDPDMTVTPEQPEQPEQSGQPEQPEQPEQSEQTKEPEQSDVSLLEVTTPKEIGTVTFSIETRTIDGTDLVAPTSATLYEGDTVYTLLDRVAAGKSIEVKGSPSMVSSIGGIAAGKYGTYSGWMVSLNNDVNMELPEVPKANDIVRWHYSVDWWGYDIILFDKIVAAKELATKAAEKLTEVKDDPTYTKLGPAIVALNTKLTEIDTAIAADRIAYITENDIYGNGDADDESETTVLDRLTAAVENAMTGYVPVTGATISVVGNPTTYYVGQTYQLQANFEPANATDQTPIWSFLLETDKASINEKGQLTITAPGLIMIELKHSDTENKTLKTLTIYEKDIKPKSAATEAQITDVLTKLPSVLTGKLSSTMTNEWHYAHLTLAGQDTSSLTKSKQDYIAKTVNALQTTTKATDFSRYTIALQAMGVDVTALPGKNGNTINVHQEHSKVALLDSTNGAAFALIAFDSVDYPDEKLTNNRQTIIQYLMDREISGGGWALSESTTVADSDITNMVIMGLAPYYDANVAVKAAVDRALAMLKTRVLDNGVMPNVSQWGSSPNSNSTSRMIMALTALGRNPATDADFISKSGSTLLDGLMLYAMEDGQFQYTISNKPSANDMATEQAYGALLAYQQVKSTNAPVKLYDFTKLNIPSQEQKTTVSLRIEGMQDTPLHQTVDILHSNASITPEDVLKQAVPEESRTITTGSYGPYVSMLYGETEKYFGGYDGWLYMVNGKSPSVGIGDYHVLPGDDIVFYYGGDTVIPNEPKVTYSAGSSTVQFTHTEAQYDADWNVTGYVEKPIADATITWYYGESQTITKTTDAQGIITLEPQYSQGGSHKLQINKAQAVAGKDKTLPLVVRFSKDKMVSLEQQTVVSGDKTVAVTKDDLYTIYTVTGGAKLALKTTVKSYGSGATAYQGGSIPKFDAVVATTKGNITLSVPKQDMYTKTGVTWDGTFYAPYVMAVSRSANVEYTVAFGTQGKLDKIRQTMRLTLPNVGDKKVGFLDADGKVQPIELMTSDAASAMPSGKNYGFCPVAGGVAIWAKADDPIVVYSEAGGGTPTPSDKITVSFTLKGDTKHGDAAHSGNFPTWIATKKYTLSTDATVKDLFEAALNEAGIAYISDGSYVSSINGLAEFDNGPKSGWVYTVNGIKVGDGYADYSLDSGDVVIWKYIDSYTDGDIGGVDTANPEKPAEGKPMEFPDVPANHPNKAAIDFVSAKGLMSGTETGFAPEKTASRAEVITVLFRYAGQPTVSQAPAFADVKAGDWYYNSVAWASSTGITKGTAEGFTPNGEMTVEQMAVMLYSFAKDQLKAAGQGTVPADTADWAVEAMQWASANGLFQDAKPKAVVSRADLAKVITVLDKALQK